jgi:hypothetical protein
MKFSTLEHYQQVLSCLQALDCCLANADQPAPELHATTVQHQPKSTAILVPVATKPTSRGRKTSAKQRRTSSTKQTNIDNTVGNGPNLVPSDSTYNSNPGQINFLSSGPLSGNSTRPLLPDFQAQSSTTSMISRQLSQNRPSSIRSRPTSALPTITEIPETPSSMLQHSSAMTGLEENVGVSATTVVPMPEIAMNMPPSRWPSANRGLGTTTFLQMVEDLSGQIPPRRELPFDRPSSAPQRQHVVLEPTRPLTVTGMEFTEPCRGLYGENTTDTSIIPGPSTHHDGAARPQPILTEKPRQPEGFPNALRPTMAPSSKRKAVEPLSDGPSSAVQPLPPPYSSRPGTAALSSPTEPLAALGNLAGFNALPSQRRDSLMEDAIIQCLKDDNFVDFCEHFEGMWQRIGLDIHQSRR